jgi:pectate lyase
VKSLGHGILDGLDYPRFRGPTRAPVDLDQCENALVEGIIIKDSWGYNLWMRGGRNVTVRNVKIVAVRCLNDDGINRPLSGGIVSAQLSPDRQ